MGIVKDLRKEVEQGKRKIAAAERIMQLWRKKAHEQKARADMQELLMTAMVLKCGKEIELAAEDINVAAQHHLEGRVNDTVVGRTYVYRARPDGEESSAAEED